MSSYIMGIIGMLMLEKISGRKCPECGAGSSLKIHSINTDDYESYAKETEMIMKCTNCGALIHDPLEHLKNHAADVAQMYAIRCVKRVENMAKKISPRL